MWKKMGMWLLALLAFTVFLTGGSLTARADNESLDGQISGLDSPTEVRLDDASKADGLGDLVSTGDEPLSYQYKSGNYYHLVYNFTIKPGTKITNGSFATVNLPTSNIDPEKLSFKLTKTAMDETTVGHFERDEGSSTGKIIFNKALVGDDTYTVGVLNVTVRGTSNSGGDTGGGKHNVVDKVGWVPKGKEVQSGSTEYPTETGWNIVFNYDEENMGDVTLVDTLGPHQTFDDNSFTATETEGGVDKTIDFSDDQQVEITSNGSEKKMVFKNVTGKISLQYYSPVDFKTLINQDLSGGHLSNYVELTAENGETGSSGEVPGSGDDTGKPAIVGKSHNDIPWGDGGSGNLDGSSSLGSMVFTKQDVTSKAKLKNAYYTLRKKEVGTNNFTDVMTFSTDYAGVFTTNSLPVGTYDVVETKAPVGYQLNPTASEEFTIATTDDTSTPHQIVQSDIPFKVTLTKTAQATQKPLAGATYKLYYAGTLNLASNLTYTTASNGQLTVSPIAKGSYDFIEQSAPTGYKRDATPIPFTISDDASAPAAQPTGPEVNVSQKDESSVPTPTTDSGSESGSSSSSSTFSSSGSSSSSSSSASFSSHSSSDQSSTRSTASTNSSSAKRTTSSHADKLGSNPVVSSSYSGHNGGAGGTASASQPTAKQAADANRILPRTNEGKTILAVLGGFLLIGSGLSLWQYRRTRKN